MRSLFTLTITTLAVALLAACGGSSGGGFTPAQVVAVEITAANAAIVASDSLNAAAFAGELGNLTGTGILGGPAAPGMLSKLAQLPVAGMSKVYGHVFEVTVGPITELCVVSGTVTLTATVADPNTITAGDSISASFNLCNDGDGQVLDGDLDMVFTAFSGDPYGAFLMTVSVTLTNLSMDDGSEVGAAVVDGGFDMTTDTRDYPVTTTVVSGDLLSLAAANRNLTMKTFNSTTVLDEGILTYSVTANGTVESSRFDGQATYETILPFTGNLGNPYEGELLITGADSATITVIALDELTVRLEMDYDGDGAVDEIRDITWEEAIS